MVLQKMLVCPQCDKKQARGALETFPTDLKLFQITRA